jgi:hypothetical protein
MIVYGDRTETVRSRDHIAAIAADIAAITAMPSGISRHEAIAAAFVALGQLVQGVADADFAANGADGGSAAEIALLEPLTALANALLVSWDSDFSELPALPKLAAPEGLAPSVTLRLPEGYAFYAVYPEAYAAAARLLHLTGAPFVIGIRSIGTGLAALVANVLGAPPPLTVRPTGHPFNRTIALTPAAAAATIAPDRHYVVVDEGPGLSGSSFAAVATYLEERGVPPDRIAFLPSHAGTPGTQASPRTIARWAAAQRPVVTMDGLVPPERLATWLAGLIGPVDHIEDVSGGAWRAYVFAGEQDWPAVQPWQERRKFLVRAGGERWLVKFAGIGGKATRKLERARLLHAAGLVPEPRGQVHGFLVERWIDAAPVASDSLDLPEYAGRYLGARARLLPPPGGGASLAELAAMAQHNIGLALGEEAAASFARSMPDPHPLQSHVRRIATDNRCDRHEWLRLADGRVVKADALDHDAAHDLVGAQDIAWDVAGLIAEFDLSAADAERLILVTGEAAGPPVDRDLLAFLHPCYLAFRLGAAQLAADSLGGWPEEAVRNRAAVARYAGLLSKLLSRAAGTSRPARARP